MTGPSDRRQFEELDRSLIRMKPLATRQNKIDIERHHTAPSDAPQALPAQKIRILQETTDRIRAARAHDRPVVMAFGAHTIKNGLGPVLIALIEQGWVSHLATNGAGIIHDWEFAYQGKSSEDVQGGVARGEFGHWQETGYYINLALIVGAFEGRGYGESIGALIDREGLTIPSRPALRRRIQNSDDENLETVAAAADLLTASRRFDVPSGSMAVPHPWKVFSIQAAAHRLGVPFTGHPMIGHDIIYNHPLNHGAAIGRTAQRDFLRFAHTVSCIDGGVYVSIGSAVMSPMVFEKSMSMAQNIAIQNARPITDHFMLVVDLAPSTWDWSRGEPPEDNADYYLRFNKSFSRMGGTMRYLQADNRDILLWLCSELCG